MSTAPKAKPHLKFSMEVVKGPHAGASYAFDKPTISIGRGAENDIVLANDARVSRQHAEIKSSGEDHYLVNLSQKNFVLINGVRVQTEKLSGDCIIQIGESEIKFKPDRLPAAKASIPSFSQAMPTPPQQAPPVLQSYAPSHINHQMPTSATAGFQNQMGAHHPGPPAQTGLGSLLQDKRVRFYGLIAIAVLIGWFLLSGGKKTRKDPNAIRMSDQVQLDIQNSEEAKKKFEERKEKFATVEYSRAQENFIKGFRDFQQGQYARSREAFQVVLNLDPENDLAKRYLQLAKIKFDEQVKFSMIQGARYREKKNWRKCQSSFFNVMTMLQSRKDDPTYQEAKRYYEECATAAVGRF